MSIFDEASELLTSTESGLSGSVEYHASLNSDAVTWTGIFAEQPDAAILDDQQGRRSPNRGRLQLNKVQNGQSITINQAGDAWFVINGENWFIRGVQFGNRTLIVTLEVDRDQTIRRPQRSTRT